MLGPIAWLDLEPKDGETSLSCYPPGMFTEGRTGVFSPATCPSGWTTVSVHRNTDEPKELATTTAVCCSSYVVSSPFSKPFSCLLLMISREYTLDGGHCYREIPTVLAVPILYNTSGSTYDILAEETSVLVSATLAVHTIQALFQEEDKGILGLTYEEEIATESRDEGLTMSERVGIGVGAAIGGLLVIGIGAFLFLRRRTKKQKKYPPHEMDAIDGPVTIGPGADVAVVQHPSLSPYGGTTTLAGSLADDDSRHDDVFDGEIEVLKAQKAAIQRRIEELESVETPMDGHETMEKKI